MNRHGTMKKQTSGRKTMTDESIIRNRPDLEWEKMLPELGKAQDRCDNAIDRISNRNSYSETHT